MVSKGWPTREELGHEVMDLFYRAWVDMYERSES